MTKKNQKYIQELSNTIFSAAIVYQEKEDNIILNIEDIVSNPIYIGKGVFVQGIIYNVKNENTKSYNINSKIISGRMIIKKKNGFIFFESIKGHSFKEEGILYNIFQFDIYGIKNFGNPLEVKSIKVFDEENKEISSIMKRGYSYIKEEEYEKEFLKNSIHSISTKESLEYFLYKTSTGKKVFSLHLTENLVEISKRNNPRNKVKTICQKSKENSLENIYILKKAYFTKCKENIYIVLENECYQLNL